MVLKLGELNAVISVDDKPFDKGLDDAHGKFGKFGGKLKVAAAAAGAAAGAALAVGVVQTLDMDAANDKLAAQLGLSAAESERIGKVAGDLYADAYGSSIEQVDQAVGAVISSIDGMRNATSAALQDMTGDVLNLATAFELDVSRAAQVAGEVVSSGLAKDAGQALDLLTVSLQRVPAAVREDLLDALDEYGPFMESIGVTGEKAFALLVASAEKGMFGIDKTGDALKEFTIRATDMSTASKVGFDALGLSQEKMSAQLLKGGADGAKAFDQIIAGLLSIKDPVKQSQAALALFGTPLEDLSVAEIPAFLASLQGAAGGLGQVEGAVDRMGETLNDNAKTTLEEFKRKAQQAFTEKLAEAIPIIEKVLGFMKEHKDVVGPLAVGLGILAGSLWLAVVATAAWNAVLALNPIMLIVIAVAVLVGAILYLATKTQFFQTIWNAAWGWIKDVAGNAADWIVGKWNALVGFITGLPGRVRQAAHGLWDGLKDSFRAAINWLIDRWNNFSLTLGGGSVLGMDIPSVTLNTPNIPRLDTGGDILRTGLAVVHRGERVMPAAQAGPLGGVGAVRLSGEFIVRGSDLVLVIREMVQVKGGGDVQAAFGQ